MKKSSIVSIIIGVILVVVSFAAFEFSGTSILQVIQEISDDNNYRIKEYSIDATNITEISVDSDNDKIIVLPNVESDQVVVKYYESDTHTFNIQHNEDELSIEKKSTRAWKWFSFGAWHDRQVEIYVPVGLNIEYSLETSNGAISVDNLDIKELDIETSNGSVELKQLFISNEAEIKTSNAHIELSDIKVNSISMKTSNGLIKLGDVNVADWIYAKTSNASIEFNQLSSGNIIFDTSNGKVVGSIVGDNDDYQKALRTSNGEMIIDDTEYGKSVNTSKGHKFLNIKTSNARVEISFDNRGNIE